MDCQNETVFIGSDLFRAEPQMRTVTDGLLWAPPSVASALYALCQQIEAIPVARAVSAIHDQRRSSGGPPRYMPAF